MKRLIVFLCLMLLIPLSAFALTGTTKTTNLNVRKSPASTSDRVTIIKAKGEPVEVIREETNRKGVTWYYVKLKNGRTGYIQAEYIDVIREEESEGSHRIRFKTTHTGGETYNNVGDIWTFYYEINGKIIDRDNPTLDFIAGEEYVFYARIREQDNMPDTGKDTVSYVPTSVDVQNGFEVEQKVRVEENSGPYRGKSVVWTVRWIIQPAVEETESEAETG